VQPLIYFFPQDFVSAVASLFVQAVVDFASALPSLQQGFASAAFASALPSLQQGFAASAFSAFFSEQQALASSALASAFFSAQQALASPAFASDFASEQQDFAFFSQFSVFAETLSFLSLSAAKTETDAVKAHTIIKEIQNFFIKIN
jgi:hypothetical protein